MAGLALGPRLLLPALLLAAGRAGASLPNCDVGKLNVCGSNQICKKDLNGDEYVCQCIEGFVYDSSSNECIKSHQDDVPDHSSATSIIVTVITLTLIICALILVIRRYNLINWLRHKFNLRDNSVMYEDVMIGQDDTPIAA